MKCICPLCEGVGKIEYTPKPDKVDLKKAAKRLRGEGYTIRQIMVILGFKHPGSVSHILK
jgi:hypothetical protein